MGQNGNRKIRRDGWTPERQLRFLDALAKTRNVTQAAQAVGMSRESAHRLRARDEGGLFSLLWDRALRPPGGEGHSRLLTNGYIARQLGNHYRRERGEFSHIGVGSGSELGT